MPQQFQDKKLELIDWLMRPVDKAQPKPKQLLHRAARVLYALVRDLMHGSLTLHAMSLVFTTILSIIPFLALTFSLLRYFNVQNHLLPMIEHFLLPMGDKGEELHQTILQFVDNIKVGVLGAVGLLVLLYTVISLLQKIEHAFNSIWYVADTRSFAKRFSKYISMIFVGPILMVAAISLASDLVESALIARLSLVEPLGLVFSLVTNLMPFMIMVAAFGFFFILVPNTRVRTQQALIGAVVSVVLWHFAGQLFTAFVVSSARYDVIYSGFAIGIVALLWVYATWLILLIGASVAFYLQNDNYITRSIDIKGAPAEIEQIALRVMHDVAKSQERSGEPLKHEALESMPGVPGLLVRQVVEILVKGRLLIDAGPEGDCFVLVRSSDKVTVAEILELVRKEYGKPVQAMPEAVQTISKEIDDFLSRQFQAVTLRDMIKE